MTATEVKKAYPTQPNLHAWMIVHEALLEVLREQQRVSAPECRQLRRVLDYLDILCDIEAVPWPDTING